MPGLELSLRLKTIADYIPTGSRVIDVGTDHGYLPAYLAIDKRCSGIIASDLRRGPLDHARQTAEELGLTNDRDLRLAPGLEGVSPDEVDTIVISGMGGETIISILEAAPWVHDNKRLILQPQSKLEDFRLWLAKNDFITLDEKLIYEAGKYYFCFLIEHGKTEEPDLPRQYFGAALQGKTELELQYLEDYRKRIIGAYNGMLSAENACGERLETCRKLFEFLNNYLEENHADD